MMVNANDIFIVNLILCFSFFFVLWQVRKTVHTRKKEEEERNGNK